MVTIDMSNKHKRKYVAFVELIDGHKVIAVFDTLSKFERWLANSIGIDGFTLYDGKGKEVVSI